MLEKSENFNSLRPILFELCKSKKKTTGGGKIDPPTPAGIGLTKIYFIYQFVDNWN